ncbi:MAG: hypothetical protein M1541_17620 [Acidobacteria bacterium]|nr:hypothetical protein [Acidobacteriota bacterium]
MAHFTGKAIDYESAACCNPMLSGIWSLESESQAVRVEGKEFFLTAGSGYGMNILTAFVANAILRFNPASTEVEVKK